MIINLHRPNRMDVCALLVNDEVAVYFAGSSLCHLGQQSSYYRGMRHMLKCTISLLNSFG